MLGQSTWVGRSECELESKLIRLCCFDAQRDTALRMERVNSDHDLCGHNARAARWSYHHTHTETHIRNGNKIEKSFTTKGMFDNV